MSGMPPMPTSLEDALDFTRREGFYEEAVKLTEKRLARVYQELGEAQRALQAEMARVAAMEDEIDLWRSLAIQYGAETTVEKRARTGTLHGEISIARELVVYSGEEAITLACVGLAKKLHAATTPRRPPTGGTP
jgi:hypothetical protein